MNDIEKQQLSELIAFRSVSPNASQKSEINDCANWLLAHLKNIGFNRVEKFDTEGNPIIYADYAVSDDKPTLLFYGHYDVQPADEHNWDSEPFELVERDGLFYARGIADDKGQILIFLNALSELMFDKKGLGFGIKVLLEGEEEIGSTNVNKFIESQVELLESDYVLICDSSMKEDNPVLEIGLRGLVLSTLVIKNGGRNLHSGVFGGAVVESSIVAAKLISELVDYNGQVNIPGFYEGIPGISATQKEYLADSHKPEDILRDSGAKVLIKNNEFTPLEMSSLRPAMSLNGFHAGATINSPGTVIPNETELVISFRLAVGQDPADIKEKFKNFVAEKIPEGIEYKMDFHSGAKAVVIDPTSEKMSPIVSRIRSSAENLWPGNLEFHYVGGTIGTVSLFDEILGAQIMLMGFSLPNAHEHGANENMPVSQFDKGKEFLKKFLSKD